MNKIANFPEIRKSYISALGLASISKEIHEQVEAIAHNIAQEVINKLDIETVVCEKVKELGKGQLLVTFIVKPKNENI